MSATARLREAGARPAAFVESLNATNGEVVAQFAATASEDIPDALLRARDAQMSWAAIPLLERCRRLRRMRDVILQRRDEITEVIATETGKPRVEAMLGEIAVALDLVRYYAGNAQVWLRPARVKPSNRALWTKRGRLEFEPWGVVGVITPWNYPFSIPMGEIIAAVVAGNAVLLKPSELTPWCGALTGEVFAAAGFPPDLLQVLQGDSAVGAALVKAAPDKIFFTGSAATGRRIAGACAEQLIPSVLELGGKGAMIVLADANLRNAASAAVWGSMTNCGQACISVERLYVEQTVAAEFIRLCVAEVEKLRFRTEPGANAEIGPLIRSKQIGRIERQIADAIQKGAAVAAGGKRRPDLGAAFFEPTILSGTNHSMDVMAEETFGPVLPIAAVADAEEALRMANDSPYALSASVWTGDTRRGNEIALRVHAGSVMVNDAVSYYGNCAAPHGGRGSSGWGRMHSRLGLMEMVHVKYVDAERLPRLRKAWWFPYDSALESAADAFLDVMHAPRWMERMQGARKSLPVFLGRTTRRATHEESRRNNG